MPFASNACRNESRKGRWCIDMTNEWLGLEGAGVLLVGAGGIGSACAKGFSDAGAKVLLADLDEDRVSEVAGKLDLEHNGGGSLFLDATDASSCREAVRTAQQRFGALDVMVHCVGMNVRKPVLELSDGEWTRTIELNLSSGFFLGQAAGHLMCEQGSGSIVYFSSVSGLLAHKLHAPYAASKGGMNQMMRVMAAEWAIHGVRVNAIAPGYTETELTREYLSRPGVREGLERLVPWGRLGTPQDLVDPALFLASPRSGYVTGHILFVDGGRTLT